MLEPKEITEEMKKKIEAEGQKTLDPCPCLTELEGEARLCLFVNRLMKRGLKIDKVWTSRGGNEGFHCLAMC